MSRDRQPQQRDATTIPAAHAPQSTSAQREPGARFSDDRPAARALRQLQRAADARGAHAVLQRKPQFTDQAAAAAHVTRNPVYRTKDITGKKYANRLKEGFTGKEKLKGEDLAWLEAEAETAFKASSGIQRKALGAAQWTHIWRGDVDADQNPTGFHWKGKESEALHQGVGALTSQTNGFYRQAVQSRESGKMKSHPSSFFPDGWSEQDVRDAIELRNSNNEITTPKPAIGQKLATPGDTVYPLLP